MRLAIGLFLPVVLAACSREPSFDERYDAAQKQLKQTSARIDADLKARADAAASAVPTGGASGNP